MTIEEIIEILKNGGTILYPTDTIWGIGCDATNSEACNKINKIKNRSLDKSFILLVDGFPMIERYVPEFNPICYDLADLTERPLTIIYPSAKNIAPEILAPDGTIGMRITKDPICLKLIRSLKRPLVSTSANISGKSHPTSFGEIEKEILQNVDGVLEMRTNETLSIPSQIIKIDLDGTVKVLRN